MTIIAENHLFNCNEVDFIKRFQAAVCCDLTVIMGQYISLIRIN